MNILSIDQGTTGTTVIVYDEHAQIKQRAYREIKQYYPQPGYVEHDPEEIWATVVDAIKEVMHKLNEPITSIGITNQRETTVLWDKTTGQVLHNAIVWQCRRTSETCKDYSQHAGLIKDKTGLLLDSYFSATKIQWILNNKKPSNISNICFGTIDTWLLWKLTGGVSHFTDHTNASRTLLYNISENDWDDELLELFEIPRQILPEIKNSIDDYGLVKSIQEIEGVPVNAIAGDQQAALFGHACFDKGEAKNTYGTGCFLVMNTGDEIVYSGNGLVTTVAVDVNGKPCYALEGAIFSGGLIVQWLRDEMKLIAHASESEIVAMEVDSNAGVYLVPAFTGLGAPHWDMDCRATIMGLTRGTGRSHIVRAALEAIAYQVSDIVECMEKDLKIKIAELKVDGGATENNFLMQFQADIINKPVKRPVNIESTSLGVFMMAGIKQNAWKSIDELLSLIKYNKTFESDVSEEQRLELLKGWGQSIKKVISTENKSNLN